MTYHSKEKIALYTMAYFLLQFLFGKGQIWVIFKVYWKCLIKCDFLLQCLTNFNFQYTIRKSVTNCIKHAVLCSYSMLESWTGEASSTVQPGIWPILFPHSYIKRVYEFFKHCRFVENCLLYTIVIFEIENILSHMSYTRLFCCRGSDWKFTRSLNKKLGSDFIK